MPGAKAMRTASRCFVYDLRKYKEENEWGPFLKNQVGKVSWVHIDHIIKVVTMNLEDIVQLWSRMRPPAGLTAVRPYSAPGTDKTKKDWAGVEGNWYRYVCFMDYRLVFYPFTLFTEVLSAKCCYFRDLFGEFSGPLSEQFIRAVTQAVLHSDSLQCKPALT